MFKLIQLTKLIQCKIKLLIASVHSHVGQWLSYQTAQILETTEYFHGNKTISRIFLPLHKFLLDVSGLHSLHT